MATRNQQYAISAYENVSAVTDAQKQKYGTMCHKLPILIRQAGLVQALTFVEARGEAAQTLLLDHIANTLPDTRDKTALLTQARGNGRDDLMQYMLLTRRVLDVMVWYKRFAQSVLSEGGENE